jgi:phosphate-selective porin OprO and OprP
MFIQHRRGGTSAPRRRALVQRAAIIGTMCVAAIAPSLCRAQSGDGPAPKDATPASTTGDTLDAAEADGAGPRRELVHWNEYEGPYFTARLGGGFLVDYSTYAQDDDSRGQMTLSPASKLRDFRLLLKGRFPAVPRLTYTLGYMYDAAQKEWRFRQTGFMFNVPELYGNIFVGRTKEGFSTNKLMVGYHGWTIERSTANDAFLPILADGVKWTGSIPGGKLVYNLGWFKDTRSQAESFNKNDNQFAARAVWLPFVGADKGVLHLALEARYGEANDGQLQYRSKPESFEAQTYAVDTGKFAAHHANTLGFEAYYSPGPLMFGMEYFFNQVSSTQADDPLFHGGEILVACLLTGETRPYNAKGAFFEAVSPARSVFDGGPGAWELVLRLSYTDLDSGTIGGGKFWRITPLLNWHLSDNVRLEFAYGYGELDRFGVTGGLQFFQTRLQLTL